jgi:phenylpropionate dioxygenase-like ring-hydroxylating dioxygenase large terminal subunit
MPMSQSRSLPAWIYHSRDFFELERERIFKRSWQLLCHVNDIPKPGDYQTMNIVGEPVFVVRTRSGEIKAYYNVCRHRAARLLDGDSGNCGNLIRCPYHAWSYSHEGALVAVPHRELFEDFDEADHGLVPIACEITLGFIFVRLKGNGPSSAELLAPFADEMGLYRLEELEPLGRVTLRLRDVNWKNIADNYTDALHIPIAHDGLFDLLGHSYAIEAKGGAHKMSGDIDARHSNQPSISAYRKFLPAVDHLPKDLQRHWAYYRFWPNFAFDIYPDQVDFMQFIPISETQTIIREIPYALPDDRREMKASRYLNWRINRIVNLEDKGLIERVQEGMSSESYTSGPLAKNETLLKDFARQMHDVLPISREPVEPDAATMRQALCRTPAGRD